MHTQEDQVEIWMEKRKAYFEQIQKGEQGVVQKERVIKQFIKIFKGKQLCKAVPEDVVKFLIFKEI